MKDIMLMIAVLAVFAFGFYIMKFMKGVDDILCENYKNIHIDAEKNEPSCVMLTDNISEEEIIKEIREFKEKHGTVVIYLCDNDSVMDAKAMY